jgi:hypothetical protein
MSDSAFWVEEGEALRHQGREGGSDEERKGTEMRDW